MKRKTLESIASELLRDLEIELDARVGSMEHNTALMECVIDSISDLEVEPEEECNCTCKVCSLASHHVPV